MIEFVRAGRMAYQEAWDRQRDLHARRVSDAVDDTVLLLEHDPVYTAGKRTEPWERPTDGSHVVDVDRGGKITWHGPGQVTGYPIVRLADPIDVVAYVRRLEQVLMDVCAALGLPTVRVEGRSGDFLHVPEGGVHGFRNESGEPASMLILFTPGAPREDYFETLADAARRASMSEDAWTAFYLRHDTFWVDEA